MKRVRVSELMDQPSPNAHHLAESLNDLAWVNRYLGGTPTLIHQLRWLLRGYDRSTLSVLDVGAGGADILISLAAWCASRQLPVSGVAYDLGRETVRFAARALARSGWRDAFVVRGNALALPFPDQLFDVTICNTFLHHLDPEDAVRALAEMARVSRWGIIVSDLRRSLAGYLATWLISRTVWRRHPYGRHDGPASIRAAYSPGEAAALAEQAGLNARIARQIGFRWALRWKRSS